MHPISSIPHFAAQFVATGAMHSGELNWKHWAARTALPDNLILKWHRDDSGYTATSAHTQGYSDTVTLSISPPTRLQSWLNRFKLTTIIQALPEQLDGKEFYRMNRTHKDTTEFAKSVLAEIQKAFSSP